MKVSLRRTTRRTLGAVVLSAGLVVGAAGAASAYSDPAVSCVNFVHTDHWYSTTQKVVGTYTCGRYGAASFVVHDRVPGLKPFVAGYYAASSCLPVSFGKSAGWQWPRPGRDYYITGC